MIDLVYDIGMHDGEDSAFYLAKGFRVVAVEADPEFCLAAEQRFSRFIEEGRLTIVNRAIAPTTGPVTFYRSTTSGWGTVVEDWNRDNAARGVAADSIVVEGMRLADLLAEHGEPFFLKIDIEGMDRRAIESLSGSPVRPRYLSMETAFSRAPTMASIRADFETLSRLGYDRFKIIDQSAVPHQVSPSPARVGQYVDHQFSSGQSGLFGEESPGDWLTADAALQSFRRTCRKNWLPLLLYRNTRIFLYYSKIAYRLNGRCPNLSWYDIHAKHCTVD